MSRQTVSFPTLCLLGQPHKAIGLESQIEPWLAHAIPCSLRREEIGRKEQKNPMSLLSPVKGDRTTSLRHRASPQRAGAGCRKNISPLQHHQKCFFLTSPFIEHSHGLEDWRYMSSRAPSTGALLPQRACNGCLRSRVTHVPVHSLLSGFCSCCCLSKDQGRALRAGTRSLRNSILEMVERGRCSNGRFQNFDYDFPRDAL